jgi:hypothetical protein
MNINRLMLAGAGLIVSFLIASGCESGQSQRSGASPGPSPSWIEEYHREQLRYEYERQKYEEQMQSRQ